MSQLSPSRRAGVVPAVLVAVLLAACTPSGLSGTYEAKDPEGTMTIVFKSGGKMTMTMQAPGSPADTKEGDYLVDGNKVTLQLPGGIPLTLVKNGKTLDATMLGQIMHFEKK